jgi:hypothetical protein
MTRQLAVTLLALAGCTFNEGTPVGGSLEVSGKAIEFPTGTAIDGSISVNVTALTPLPKITTDGPTYLLDHVPENSVFQILAAAPPTHRATFSRLIEVIDQDLENVDVPVTSEMYLSTLATAFNVTQTAANGVLFVRLTDATGMPRAGVARTSLALPAGGPAVRGPFFLDASMMPAPTLMASSTSGYAVFFEVAPSSVSLAAATGANVTLDMPASPINASAVTIADAKVTDGPPPVLPTNVSFSRDVFPIFGPAPMGRGCVACHSSDGQGRKLGNLALNQPNPSYNELKDPATTPNAQRVNLLMPEASLLLVKPLLEMPPNHQNATFATTLDKDYLKILVWIREGAKDN